MGKIGVAFLFLHYLSLC